MYKDISLRNTRLLLIVIIVAGAIMRLMFLDNQSLWGDELNSMRVGDPDISWQRLFELLKLTDQHPPLYFVIIRTFFNLFGHTAVVLRVVSALAGIWAIWGMFLLGRELLDRRLGLIMAMFTSVNFYLLSQSQEGRNYSMLFLTAIFSLIYFIRLLKVYSLKNSLLYALFTLLLMYTHYFGMFVLAAQFIIGIVFFAFEERSKRPAFFKYFGLSTALIVGIYLLWLPYLLYINSIKSFWIKPLYKNFLSDYFFEYFGESGLINMLLLLFLLVYLSALLRETGKGSNLFKRPMTAGFIILFLWILGVLLVPVLRSYLYFPIVIPRYIVIVLPAMIAIVAWGAYLIKNKVVLGTLLTCFVLFSIFHTTLVRKYYSEPHKAQFREATDYVMANNIHNYPVMLGHYWQLGYFFEHKNDNTKLLARGGYKAIDSIVHLADTKDKVEGFWLIDGDHTNAPMTNEEKVDLNKWYVLAASRYLFYAYTELYIHTHPNSGNSYFIKPENFNNEPFNFNGAEVIPVWGGDVVKSTPVMIPKGNYNVIISASGTQCLNEYPRLNILANGKSIGEFATTDEQFSIGEFDMEIVEDTATVFRIDMLNDKHDVASRTDRNGFVKFLLITKK